MILVNELPAAGPGSLRIVPGWHWARDDSFSRRPPQVQKKCWGPLGRIPRSSGEVGGIISYESVARQGWALALFSVADSNAPWVSGNLKKALLPDERAFCEVCSSLIRLGVVELASSPITCSAKVAERCCEVTAGARGEGGLYSCCQLFVCWNGQRPMAVPSYQLALTIRLCASYIHCAGLHGWLWSS